MNEQALEIINHKKQRTIKSLSSVYNLPSIPYVIFEVTKMIENPMASAAQLAKIITKDQGLVTKILSVANSPLYGIPRRVSTIDFAIVILGFNHIKDIVIALSLLEAFKKIGDKKFEQKAYWTHSILTASAAKRIADDLGYTFSGEVFTAGLLHDLGIPIIYKYFNQEYKKIIELTENDEMTFHEAEIETLGVSHSEIGKHLMGRWNLPDGLADAVNQHHKPSDSEENKELAALIHLADYMTYKLGYGGFSWDKNYELDKATIDILKLGDEEYLENFIKSYEELFSHQINSIQF